MNQLQKEFEEKGYSSWINSHLYPNGKVYTNEYVEWLEKNVTESRESKKGTIIKLELKNVSEEESKWVIEAKASITIDFVLKELVQVVQALADLHEIDPNKPFSGIEDNEGNLKSTL